MSRLVISSKEQRRQACAKTVGFVCLVGVLLGGTVLFGQAPAVAPATAPGPGAATQPVPTTVPAPAAAATVATAHAGGHSSPGTSSPRVLTGTVKSGNTSVPGATVTATNPATGQKVVGWTQTDGSYKLQLPGDGEYVVRAQMAAFATAIAHVTVTESSQSPHADLQIVLLSRAQAQGASNQARMAGAMRGFQALSVMQGEGGAEGGSSAADQVVPQGMPVPGLPTSIATESVSVSGAQTPGFANMSMDEMRARFAEYRDQNAIQSAAGGPLGGGFGGPGGFGGGPMMVIGGGGGGRGGFNFNQPHGTLYYSADDASLDAAPFALRGVSTPKPAYLQQRFGGAVGGPLIIPHVYNGASKTFFFLHYNGTRGDQPFTSYSTVPTLAERKGDFSQTTINGQQIQIFDPATRMPFPNATIPQTMINSASKALLSYIPMPNLPGTTQNFRFVTAAEDNTNNLNFRLNQAIGGTSIGPGRGRNRGPTNNLSFGFHWSSTDQTLTNAYPTVGGHTNISQYDIPLGWTKSLGRLINNLRFDYNRTRLETLNLYAYNTDITGLYGITGVSTNPFDWGLPNLQFSHYGGIQDTNPVLNRNQTVTISDSTIYSHGKHTWRWGGDFRRLQVNTETASNPRGTYVFTGLNTSEFVDGVPVPGTGFDFADFLLGLPQQTSVQYGTNPYGYHFRGDSWDAYVQDTWRIRGDLTFNLGLRYEYFSPFSEINNSIVNLNTTPGFTAVAPVFPGQTGALTGASYPITLVNPDRNNFAPRIGIAWKAMRNTVIRAGYGINYNTAAYQNIAQNLAFQPPFSVTQTNVESAATSLTLQNGFPATPPGVITNNYGINLNYRLGYVQIWNLDIQQEITPTLLLNLDYTGTKGTHLDILEAPNRTPTGIRIPGVPVFYWQDGVGDSNANAGNIRLRKRLSHGISTGGRFTWSKALDDASTIGSGIGLVSANGQITGTTLVAQNPFDLPAEYGLSSFNQEFRFTGDWLWELPFGPQKRWLNNRSVVSGILGNWQWSGDWTIASGLPFTPRILGSLTDVNSGVNGTLRPDVTGQPVALSNPSIYEWFNTAAFVAPPLGQFGDARRNSIIGPGQLVFDMAMTKVIPLKESRNLELRMQASNVFNRPQYETIDTVLNSPTFGEVTAVGAMRTILMTARFRF